MAKTKIKPHLWLRNGVFYCRIELAKVEGKRRYLCYSLYTNDYYEALTKMVEINDFNDKFKRGSLFRFFASFLTSLLFSCSQGELVKYEYFSNGEVSVFYNLDETKGDSYKIEYYQNGRIAKVYRKDGYEEIYTPDGNLMLLFDDFGEKYKFPDGSFATGKFEIPCRDDIEKICATIDLKDGRVVNN